MITSKFGGTSVTPQNFQQLKKLFAPNGCIVVSAIGKEFAGDQKVTDLLFRHFRGDESAWSKISDKFVRLVTVNGVQVDIEKLLFQAKRRSSISLPHCLSLGEELTAKVASHYLDVPYLEADELFRFEKDKLNVKRTLANLKGAFCGLESAVVGGFYGGCENGRQIFSRGGGDVSGALCAVATESVIYQNYTDVNGVCNADPNVVLGTQTIPHLSYDQMFLLAKCGASVLHPDAVKIAKKYALPIQVANCCNPHAPSTVISNCPSMKKFLAVTENFADGKFSATVLHSACLKEVFCRLQLLESEGGGKFHGIKSVNVTENVVQIQSKVSVLHELFQAFFQN